MLTLAIVGLVVFVVSGAILFSQKTSGSKSSPDELIVYQGDTIYIAEIDEMNYLVTVQQLCSESRDHTIEVYLAPNCDLQPHCFNVNSGRTTVNSTRSPTVTVVQFNGQSHIYTTSGSNITFNVDISTPMANTSVVIFDNYTYFTDFEHSDNPSTDKAFLEHMFKGLKSSYTFESETNTYFAAFESLIYVNFSFYYSGYVCNYSHLDYKKSECDLPGSTCQEKNCTYKYQSHNKTCILAYVPPSVTKPSFAYLLVETYRKNTTSKKRTAGIALLYLIILPGVALLVCGIIIVFCCCRK